MSVVEMVRDVVDESMESMELAARINGLHLEPAGGMMGPRSP
jgi:hypothetical protein